MSVMAQTMSGYHIPSNSSFALVTTGYLKYWSIIAFLIDIESWKKPFNNDLLSNENKHSPFSRIYSCNKREDLVLFFQQHKNVEPLICS